MEKTIKTLCRAFFCIHLMLASIGCQSQEIEDTDEHESGGKQEAEFTRGVHGGRLFEEKGFQLELLIVEVGATSYFRCYPYFEGKPLLPSENDVKVNIETTRLGEATEHFNLTPVDNFLSSSQEVREPHSFDVRVEAHFNGKQYKWGYESYEGRITLSPEVVENADITLEQASSRVIAETIKVRGKIAPSEHRIAHIIPRFSGIVREAKKHIGDAVAKGEVLAIIESNQSLQPYEVRSQIAGTVISGHLIVGEFVPENQWIYVVADFSEVWADFWIPSRQQHLVREDRKVVVNSADGDALAIGKVSFVAPYAEELSQSRMVRVVLPNAEKKLLPGMYVSGEIIISETTVPVAVKTSAIQSFQERKVVFVNYGNVFEARPLELGATDGEWAAVVRGIEQGTIYVTDNSFLIKSDILKSGTSHEH